MNKKEFISLLKMFYNKKLIDCVKCKEGIIISYKDRNYLIKKNYIKNQFKQINFPFYSVFSLTNVVVCKNEKDCFNFLKDLTYEIVSDTKDPNYLRIFSLFEEKEKNFKKETLFFYGEIIYSFNDILLYNNFKATDNNSYEIPLVNVLLNNYDFNVYFRNLAIVQKSMKKVLCEFDLILYKNHRLYIIEIKNKFFNEKSKFKNRISVYSKWIIKFLTEKYNVSIDEIIPIVYFKHKSDKKIENINIIYFEDIKNKKVDFNKF